MHWGLQFLPQGLESVKAKNKSWIIGVGQEKVLFNDHNSKGS